MKQLTVEKNISMEDKPLVDKDYLLEKFPCKYGWTFTEIPEIQPDKKSPFSRVKVKGSIDGYEISKYHLMPSGKGTLMLAVKTEIRKKIKKEAGDFVHITLFPDNEPLEVPEEFLLCLQDDAEALQFFNSLNESEQHNYIKWIYSAKTEQTKVERIAEMLVRLSKRQKFEFSKKG
jgi:hypothetical protein